MVTVAEKVTLDASSEDVWALIGGFGALHAWHPAVAACDTEQDGDASLRRLTLADGSKIVERLTAHDDTARSYTYTILDAGPLPVRNYRSTIAVSGDKSVATVSWSSEFEAEQVPEADAQAAISGVYTAGLVALVEKFGSA